MKKTKPYAFSFFNECMLFKTKSALNVLIGLTVYAVILLALFPALLLGLIFMPPIHYSYSQMGIVVFGVGALWLVGKDGPYRKYGFIMGLLGQPFWFYTAIHTEQWGIFLIAVIYTITWIRGIYNNWFKNRTK